MEQRPFSFHNRTGNRVDTEGLYFVGKIVGGFFLFLFLVNVVLPQAGGAMQKITLPQAEGFVQKIGNNISAASVAAIQKATSSLEDTAKTATSSEKVGAEKKQTAPEPKVILPKATTTPTETINPATIRESVPEEGRFIGVNLKKMKLMYFEDGEKIHEFPVLSKGEPGSRFETPSGRYEIQYKNRNHFSSIGQVYMPHSLQFYGNFFIHGWPYYQNGSSVPEGFSGGCIRLGEDDAQTLFSEVKKGTSVMIYAGGATTTDENSKDEVVLENISAPETDASSYLVADLDTGAVYTKKASTKKLPIASISKLMTAVVTNETIAYDSSIRITQRALETYGQQGSLERGQEFKPAEIYYPLLLESSNDAAAAIAGHRGKSSFIRLMNKKAAALNMDQTEFSDASGLSPKNQSSARDIFRLAQYIHHKKQFIFDITTEMQKELNLDNSAGLENYTNGHPFKAAENFRGGKHGYTDVAKHTLLSLFELAPEGKDKHTIAIITLGSNTHKEDTQKLLNWFKAAADVPNVGQLGK